MTTRANLCARILELVPIGEWVDASDVVKTLDVYPAKAVWPTIIALAFDGVIETDHPGRYDGRAMIRRLK